MIMTSSPALLAHSRPHTPTGSPKLVPLASSMTPPPTRSFARPPQARPYQSPLCSRASVDQSVIAPEGDVKRFAEMIAGVVEGRVGSGLGSVTEGVGARSSSWEKEKAELIVDIPVWSPGCFQDLSTLHALRDTTLSHTHVLLSYLATKHHLPASYRLLARSSPPSSSAAAAYGWGCIRLSPPTTASQPRYQPKRRTSFVKPERRLSNELSFEHAVADEDEDDRQQLAADVRLRDGYGSASGSGSDEEEEDESADSVVAREIQKRGCKEGSVGVVEGDPRASAEESSRTAFVMTLFGQPALILI
ncbi:hypothetical protein P7C73_g2158, partial [Tremellales sp. Uapishka_1]